MHNYSLKEISNKSVWEEFILKQKPKSFLQSWNWGEVNVEMGETVIRVGYYDRKRLVGACQMITQNAKRGRHIIIPGGPLIDWTNEKLVAVWTKSIRDEAVKHNAWFVRVRPELINTSENKKLLSNLGFKNAPMHLHSENTWILEINKSDDEILAGMRKNTRYMVRKSLQIKFGLKRSTKSNDANILYNLQKETVKRHGFVGFSKKLFEIQINKFSQDNQSYLYILEYRKKPIAAAIIIFYGDMAYYHHSASSTLAREVPASYYLQWQIIQDAKKRGLKYYNFWGVAPEGVTNHRFSGVTTFKTGFGGERIDWLHAMDLPISKKYFGTYIFELARKRLRHL